MSCSSWELSPGTSLLSHLEGWMGRPGLLKRKGDPWLPPRLRNACGTPCSQGTDKTGMRSRSPSQSRHRAAYSLLNPGSSALAHTFPLQKGLELGVQQARARGEGRNPWGKALGDDSPALDHPGASLWKSTHLWDALWKPTALPRHWGISTDLRGGSGWGQGYTPASHGPTGRHTKKPAAPEHSDASTKCPGPTSIKWIF